MPSRLYDFLTAFADSLSVGIQIEDELMRLRKTRIILAALSCLGMLSGPLPAIELDFEATPGLFRPTILDVKLDRRNALHGEVRDATGKIESNTEVQLRLDAVPLQRTRTNRWGRFVFPGLKGGTYQILTPATSVTCRVWTADVAPPKAQAEILVVSNIGLSRGQQPIRPSPVTSAAGFKVL